MLPVSIEIAPEVSEALGIGRGVVALESTLIAHGLPWPINLETAIEAERLIREAGSVPATIAIVEGVIWIGLDRFSLERVARSGLFLKASRRDLSWVMAQKRNAATTVSSTLWLARKFGLSVMARGGWEVSTEERALDRMEHSLSDALNQAETNAIRGKDVTPFLLDQLRLATDGESLNANRALIVSNARLAGEIATPLANKSHIDT